MGQVLHGSATTTRADRRHALLRGQLTITLHGNPFIESRRSNLQNSADRLTRFTEIVGKERVIACSDCGFGTFAGYGAVDPEIAYAKLGTMAEGASLKLAETV